MAADGVTRSRLFYLDNLKWVLIAGVIVSHAATAYGAIGGWLYVEPTLSSVTKTIFSVLTEAGDLFALGTFMLIAGLLTPKSLAQKGAAKFVRERVLRLGAPVAISVVVVTPAVVWMIVAVTGYPLTLDAFVRWQVRWLEPGPMWFAAVLLLFSLVYATWRWILPAGNRERRPLRMRHLLIAAALIATLTFAVRLVFSVGSQQPLDAHAWQWPQLGVLFAVGALAGERGWLDARVSRTIRWTAWVAAPVTIAVLFTVVLVSGAAVQSGTGMTLYAGGWHWQSVVAAAAEGVVAVCASVIVIELFRQVGTWHGRLAQALGRDSYAAFFLQTPVLVALELALRRAAWPGEVKLALTAPAAIAICFALPWMFRRAAGAAAGRVSTSPRAHPGPPRQLPHAPAG